MENDDIIDTLCIIIIANAVKIIRMFSIINVMYNIYEKEGTQK